MSIPEATFRLAEKEFLSNTVIPKPNLQWAADAAATQSKNQPLYPSASIPKTPLFSPTRMRTYLDLDNIPLRDALYTLFKQPVFHAHPAETLSEQRARTIARWRAIASTGVFQSTISANSPAGRRKYEAIMESVGVLDHSLDIKMSVHYGLFGATVALMGDDEQARRWVPKIERCEMLGCFALTELGHGSNARGVETEARYDSATNQFVIHTPTETAQKYWIGGAFRTARWTAAFAQLIIAGVNHGIHPFLVRIRAEDGSPMPGVTLADCGHKCGLNGVDNGRIWFEHVRVPHEQLLRRHSQVSLDGVYRSRFQSADERFGASLASLSAGRISVAAGCLNQAKIGLSIAVRYALQRRAFGPRDGQEVLLLDYPSHQYRLIPPLATTFVMQLVLNQLKLKWHEQKLGKELHVWSSGFKAVFTWHSLATLQEAREACGGQGYKSENRIGPIKNGHDVALTYEGDNHILLQAVTKIVLPEFVKGLKSGGPFQGHFAYLNDREALRKVDLSTLDPRDKMYGLTIMRRREAAVFARLAAAIQKNIGGGMSSTVAFNSSAILVEEAARAHTELLVVELFHRALHQLVQKGEKEIVEILRFCGALYITKLVDSQTVFLRNGAVTQRDAERANELVMSISQHLRPHVLHMVESFGYPAHLLAPIAFDYVSHNARSRL